MPRGPSAKFDVQREQLLLVAARLFAVSGYSATSMNDVAEALGTSKANLYHYVSDKQKLLAEICENHIRRLQTLVQEIEAQQLEPEVRLHQLVMRFVHEYANAQNEHRVLTEDVKFLDDEDRERILKGERQVVTAFARALEGIHPGLDAAGLSKPLTMLLFGMINWMFTWLKPDGKLTYDDMAPLVADMFFGGINAIAQKHLPAKASQNS
jgi:AcrR family transcriptional regulator